MQQREVGTDVPSVLAGIQAGRRQDLDVLFVGEIGSVDELQACVMAAETGHLVITVLHAAQPHEAIAKILDVFPDDLREIARKAVANVLRVVCCQRLLPKQRGGRVPAYGVLAPDEEMRAAIAEGRDFMARRTPMPESCRTMADDIAALREEGSITSETAEAALREIGSPMT